jgi:hypothetical protein
MKHNGKLRRRSSKKGTKSKTHRRRLNYTTKAGDKVFHRKNHYVHKTRRPYTKKSHHKRNRKGGNLFSTLGTAVVPFSLVALNQFFGKKHHNKHHKKTHKRHS